MTIPFWTQLQHSQVRNLAWCILSPALIKDTHSDIHIVNVQLNAEIRDWLLELDNNPESLINWIDALSSPRLGHKFEHYWRFYWASIGDQDDQRFNIQINTDERTIGELDALLYYQNTRIEHIELAVKFYLGYTDINTNLTLWMGPNTNDRLDLKTQQMQNKQLALLERDQSGIPDEWNYKRVEKKLILKGRLFYPLMSTRKQHGTQTPKPLIASNTHLQAWWLRGTEADNLMDGEYWCLLNRSEWFAPLILPAETERVISRDEIINAIQNHFQSASHPIIAIKLAIITDSKNVNHPTFHEETERILLVHNQWPNAHDKPRPIT